MTAGSEKPAAPKWRKYGLMAAALIAVLGAAAVYGIAGYGRNGADPACTQAAATAKRLAPLAHGEVAAVSVQDDPQVLPALTFHDASGAERHLSDWKGRVVLLNLWATWCVPCRKEMPALAALESKLGGQNFEVVAVNIDTRNLDRPKTWLKDTGVTGLAYYADASARIFQDLKVIGQAIGMPTSILVDRSGCEIAALAGPAEWASPDALALVQAALQK
jgi:thiol-disulfide isomerase/thioredoxin